jgi:DNA modification methylase
MWRCWREIDMLIRGDARALPLRDGCVQTVVTSPPYFGLRSYPHPDSIGGELTPEAYLAQLRIVFADVWRVLRDDGTVWLVIGDCYANDGKWGGETGGKQAYLDDADRQRVGREKRITGLKPKDLIGIPWMVAFALRADGWYLRMDCVWHKPNSLPESVQDRPTRAHEFVFLFSKQPRYFYDAAAIREPYSESTVSQFDAPYEGLPIKDYAAAGVQNPSAIKRRITDKQRGHGRRHAGFNDRWDAMPKNEQQMNGANKRSVWTVATQPFPGSHFATCPEALVEPCVLAGARFGDLVLDPFCGTGTVIAVAERLGRRGVGIDLAYQDLAKARTAQRGFRFTAGLA